MSVSPQSLATKTYTTKASEALYRDWRDTIRRLEGHAQIIQNEGVEITAQELARWSRELQDTIEHLTHLRTRTVAYIVADRGAA